MLNEMLNENDMTVGTFLRLLRTQRGRPIRDVADGVGVSENYVSEIERDLKQPSDEIIRNFAKYYGMDEAALFRKFGRVPLSVTEELLKSPIVNDLLYSISRNDSLDEKDKIDMYRKMVEVYKNNVNNAG